nr:putative titan9 [Tanacetum cinerariifolium]
MEALYTKLYNKYTDLKSRKASEFDPLSFDQEQKFKTYSSAADDLIGHLKSENESLCAQISDLRHQLASVRSAKDEEQEKYEKMLTEENRKNKELSEEIEELHRKELHSSSNNDMSGSPLSSGRDNSTMRKRRWNVEKKVEVGLGVGGQHEHTSPGRSENTLDKENLFSGVFVNASQAKCCRRRLEGSVNGSDNTTCLFQELVESLLDLKFSIATQTDENIQIIAVHESS